MRQFLLSSVLSLLVILALLGGGVQVSAQSTGIARGEAKNEKGEALVGHQIQFQLEGYSQIRKTKTNKKGKFVYAGLQPGNYMVTLVRPDGERLYSLKLHIDVGDDNKVDFNLAEARAQRQQDPAYIEKMKKLGAEQAKKKKEFLSLKEHFDLGNYHLQQKKYDEAVAQFEKALQLAKLRNIAVIVCRIADTYAAAQKYDQAEENYKKALELKPDEANYHGNYALALAKMGKVEEARQEFDKAAELNPDGAANYYFNLGSALYNQGTQMDEAAQAFRKSLELNPNYAVAHFLKAQALMGTATVDPKTGEIIMHPEVVESLNAYLKLEPQGKYAPSAKMLLATATGKLETTFKAPPRKKREEEKELVAGRHPAYDFAAKAKLKTEIPVKIRSALFLVGLFAPTLYSSEKVTFREANPRETGVIWVHDNAMSERRYLPETEPPGVGIFDYNNDGWMDLILVNTGESVFFNPPKPLHHALYRNNGDGTFSEVTENAGINASLFGMGVAIGDYDGNGNQDIFITGYEQCVLYRNNGNGTFTDVTSESGIAPPGWSTAAVWYDYNNDGKLDLHVAQFVDYSNLRTCGAAESYGGRLEGGSAQQYFYCSPRIFHPTPSHLYRNDGGGKFIDVSKQVGLLDHLGKGFGVVVTDINDDGYMDVYQANDMVADFLFVNHQGKQFEEIGLPAGVGYSLNGQARSGMGVDAADFNGDGRQDLFVANINHEFFSLYENNGDLTFTDRNWETDVAKSTRMLSGWGLSFLDYDNDGRVDLILANGHPDDMIDMRSRGVTYREPMVLFHNEGDGMLKDVSGMSGEVFKKRVSGRGLAVGDLNNDGYPDVLVGVNGGPLLLLYNGAESKNNWVGLRLVGTTANPLAIGAVIRWRVGGKVHSRLKRGGGSFMSSHDPREVLGLGKADKLDWLEIRWPLPSQRVDRFTSVPTNQYLRVVEGNKTLTAPRNRTGVTNRVKATLSE